MPIYPGALRIADIHVSHLSSGGMGVSGALARACKSTAPGCSMRTVCLSASAPALGRTRHRFAVSDSEEPSQKIEFVFSASPETMRREPREDDLLRSVGYRQDLAVCAFCSSCLLRQYLCCRSPAFFRRHKVFLYRSTASRYATIRYDWAESNPIRAVRQSSKRLREPDILTPEEVFGHLWGPSSFLQSRRPHRINNGTATWRTVRLEVAGR
jgi:hypothetical protein